MKVRFPQIIFILLAAGFILISNPGLKQDKFVSPPTNNQTISLKQTAKVLKVVDGDTIKVLLNNQEDTIRLIGIDSPEILDEKKPVQCFGKEASNRAKEILINKTVTLESDPTQNDRDEYGRLLRYVFVDNLNFNQLMVSEGYAREYTFKGKAYKYQAEFIQAEKEANKENKGLWGMCRK